MDLTDLTLSEAVDLVKTQEIAPLDLMQAHLERIAALDPQLNCYITRTPHLARAQARQAQEQLAVGGPPQGLPLLLGAPMALKDLFETRGYPTTAGSTFFSGHVPEANGFAVQKMFAAGAILLGKLNMHEIALGVTNDNPHFGTCRNPWDPTRIPGGSSGGSGAALAARLCLGSLGSDTGGSIRIPASLCGVVGLKPTYGRSSLRGVIPLSWNLDHIGPLARRVRDAAMILQVIAGYDPQDPASVDMPVPDYLGSLESGVKNWRIGLASDEYFNRADPEVLSAVQAAAQVFAGLGAQVEEVAFPGAYEAARSNGLMTTSDAAAFHHDRLQDNPQGFGADVLQRLQTGAAFTSGEYIQARQDQTVLRRHFEQFFERYAVLLTPTTPVAAPPIAGPDAVEQARLLTRFTAPFNLTGLPALSLPCGFTAAGLPIGLQIVSRPWAEERVLQAGYAFEQATEWHLRKPEIAHQSPISGSGV